MPPIALHIPLGVYRDARDLSAGRALMMLIVVTVVQIHDRAPARCQAAVDLAENGAIAIDMLQQHEQQVALIILDAVMPRLSGRDTLREILRVAPGVRVIFSSGYSTEQMGVHEFPQVRGFLPKPYRAEQLIAKVNEILSEKQ